jgi:prevent-host-death family protein
MSEVASRELRNNTAGVLRRVQDGEEITITVAGRPAALITGIRPERRHWVAKGEFLARINNGRADPGLRDDLAILAGESTDDLGPLR